MSQNRALKEIKRFLETGTAEVLSISGRWGVGKTYAWDNALKAERKTTRLRRYAYVSVFGLRSIDALKTAIVQSTVSLDGEELEPTVSSYLDHLSTMEGFGRIAEKGVRKAVEGIQKVAAAIPYAGKLADLIGPGAALFIRNQIICIDDIERAGQGLDVADILGLVSMLRERRGCKVVLLLNEAGLGEHEARYREYLEKVVDQAVRFEPTAAESAQAALHANDALARALAARTASLGIINIRVIRRIRRFLSYIEAELVGLHEGVTNRVVMSIALLGWCVFEPKLAPPIGLVQRYRRFGGLFSDEKQPAEEEGEEQRIRSFGWSLFEDVDEVILDGLQAGAFDVVSLREALKRIHDDLNKHDVRRAILAPYDILRDGFGDDTEAFVHAIIENFERHAAAMTPSEASDALSFLRELGRSGEADRLVKVYVDAQANKPREFFAIQHDRYRRPLDSKITVALAAKLETMPLEHNPEDVLLDIGQKQGWNPDQLAFLTTVPVTSYVDMLRRIRGEDVDLAINTALMFGQFQEQKPSDVEVARRMKAALEILGAESAINAIRVKPYLRKDDAGTGT